ncbi:cell envelope biogenesis protein OmpA [Parapedobacter defluvii]|uniref:Cell envelope biogenesis protein OmpA n=1 Tax=Parapedobacter defluvii TaxID=2045106 RepID=A0ABQ1LHZ8_9SPHI|nr:OmpA family protein [Parapedobacter defluvii]RQP11093.1 MAG: OmpA family protein [Parapedobacter sp.]GGC22983.1 cell envelope biogenesis protein OmpA [Parapedobacter defluvii]
MITNRKIALFGLSVATSAMLLGSCSTIQSMSNTQKGAATGAVAGGALGAIIGKKAGNTAVGVLAGAALGGVAGGLIGKKMDKQAAEIERTVAGAEVIKADEGIIVKFDSGILFDFDKTDLKPDAKTNIAKLVENLNDNPDTDILVIGHTDNKGTDAYNQGLSERRAKSVKSYAVSQGLAGRRIKTEGKSFHEPIADNNTEAGRAQNRRVEIVIVANDKMRKEAKEEAGV